MAKTITGIVAWLKGWFYDKGEVDTIANSKVNLNQGQANKNVVTNASGNITVEDKPTIDSALSGTSENAVQNKVVKGALDNKLNSTLTGNNNASKNLVTNANGEIITEDKYSHPASHASNMITESSALSNLGTSANANQHEINVAVNTKIGDLFNKPIFKPVTTLPTASASTTDALYLVAHTDGWSANNQYDIYITSEYTNPTTGDTTYSWEKVDDANLVNEAFITEDDMYEAMAIIKAQYTTDLPTGYGFVHDDSLYWVSEEQKLYIWDHNASGSAYGAFVEFKWDMNQVDGLSSALSEKADLDDVVVDIELVPKATNATGAITLKYGSDVST